MACTITHNEPAQIVYEVHETIASELPSQHFTVRVTEYNFAVFGSENRTWQSQPLKAAGLGLRA